MSKECHFDSAVVLKCTCKTMSLSRIDEVNTVLFNLTDRDRYIGYVSDRIQSLEIVQHLIKEFGFSAEEVGSG